MEEEGDLLDPKEGRDEKLAVPGPSSEIFADCDCSAGPDSCIVLRKEQLDSFDMSIDEETTGFSSCISKFPSGFDSAATLMQKINVNLISKLFRLSVRLLQRNLLVLGLLVSKK